MKTKGALIREFNQPWKIEEIEMGDPQKGEVKVQMEASGMCHSDHHLVTGGIPMFGFPVLGGHEGAGVVVEVGEGVEGVAVGDHVVMSFIPSCGKCPSCQAGLRNLCDLGAGLLAGTAISDGTHRIHTADGHPVFPMTLLGTFSPYMVVHESSVVPIPKDIPFEVACLVGCGVTTGYGSATHTAQIKPGEDVAVVGVGGVGMSALQGAVNSGARYIFVIDPVEWKRDQALKFGATHVYEDINAAMAGIAEVTGGFMAKKVIVTVGEVHGADVDNYMNITAKSGTCVMTAIGSMLDTNVTLNLAMLTLMQKNLQGTIFGGGNPYYDIPHLLSMYKVGKLNLDDMITRQYRLEQINEGYQDMLEGRNIRGVIRYTDEDR
ncbi:MAG TPA: NDMA-dependent alcohol dehydrogenase [Mycobacterium sp.]|nr:NDMA-dependent alcohol dehydrogenase [Mycobacterium sp.]MCB9417234.1 NDMA-dependent alcohol dehydrogenase [Mycolicibacterium sp.]TXI46269.1 MAG: NDMA-dependent alcohol dehydrogenase [Mycobacterium sp.]HMZ13783.1 NDMA-dependent alcohol dehydrogenase [Mycobacterium sp.]HNA49616.1 NDMA-dependent alcohol dehydrogenase [Mycobacterium sp.]